MWNSNSAPNWGGSSEEASAGIPSVLFITPDPPSVASNPSIGIVDSNVVPLPTSYETMHIGTLTCDNPPIDVRNWSNYAANHNVTATLVPIVDLPQYDLSGFRSITCSNLSTLTSLLGGVGYVTSDIGNFTALNAGTATAGSLTVNGGTTLDGGTLHGTTIGSLPVAGINTVRVDVLPIGISILSAALPIYISAGTLLTLQAGGAVTVSAGGLLSLAGGDHVEINSAETRFINTTNGNDNTTLSVGTINPAYTGSAPLRLNGHQGTEIQNGLKVYSNNFYVPPYYSNTSWDVNAVYGIDDIVNYNNTSYTALIRCRGVIPDTIVANWNEAKQYYAYNYVLLNVGIGIAMYMCLVDNINHIPTSNPSFWVLQDSILYPTDFWNKGDPCNQTIAFTPDHPTDYTYSFAKPTGTTNGIYIIEQDGNLNETRRGVIYDSVINPPSIVITGNLDMLGYDIVNIGTASATTLQAPSLFVNTIHADTTSTVQFLSTIDANSQNINNVATLGATTVSANNVYTGNITNSSGGYVSIGSDLHNNGHDISGVGTLGATNVNATNVGSSYVNTTSLNATGGTIYSSSNFSLGSANISNVNDVRANTLTLKSTVGNPTQINFKNLTDENSIFNITADIVDQKTHLTATNGIYIDSGDGGNVDLSSILYMNGNDISAVGSMNSGYVNTISIQNPAGTLNVASNMNAGSNTISATTLSATNLKGTYLGTISGSGQISLANDVLGATHSITGLSTVGGNTVNLAGTSTNVPLVKLTAFGNTTPDLSLTVVGGTNKPTILTSSGLDISTDTTFSNHNVNGINGLIGTTIQATYLTGVVVGGQTNVTMLANFDMNGLNLFNSGAITTNFLASSSEFGIRLLTDLNANTKNITHVATINAENIGSTIASYVTMNNDLNLNSHNITNLSSLVTSVSVITPLLYVGNINPSSGYTDIGFAGNLTCGGHNISNVGTLNSASIGSTGTNIVFNNSLDMNSHSIINLPSLITTVSVVTPLLYVRNLNPSSGYTDIGVAANLSMGSNNINAVNQLNTAYIGSTGTEVKFQNDLNMQGNSITNASISLTDLVAETIHVDTITFNRGSVVTYGCDIEMSSHTLLHVDDLTTIVSLHTPSLYARSLYPASGFSDTLVQGNLNLQNHNLNNVNTLNVGSIGATSSPVLFNNDISLANYSANNVGSLNITNGGTINNAKLIKVKGTGSGTNAAQVNLFASTNSTTTANFGIVVDDTYTSTSLNSSSNMNFNAGGDMNLSAGGLVIVNKTLNLNSNSIQNVASISSVGGSLDNFQMININGIDAGDAAKINLFTSTNDGSTPNFSIVVDDTYASTSLNSSSNMNFNSGGSINFSGGDINFSGSGVVNVNRTLNLNNNSIENVGSLSSVAGVLGGFQMININGTGTGGDAAQLKLFSSSADPEVPNFTMVVDDTYGSCAINSLASTYFNSGADLGFGAYGNVFFNPNGTTTFNGNGDVNISPAGGSINLNTPTDSQIGLTAQSGIFLTAYNGGIVLDATPNIYGTANADVIFIAGGNLNLSGLTANISTTDGTLDISANGDLTMEASASMSLRSSGADLVLNAPSHSVSFQTSINMNGNTINNAHNIYGTNLNIEASSGDVALTAGGNLDLSGLAVTISSQDGTLDISANGDMTIEGSNITLHSSGGDLQVLSNINLNGNNINNLNSINSSGDITLNPASGHQIIISKPLNIYTQDIVNVDNVSGTDINIVATNDLSLTAGSHVNYIAAYSEIHMHDNPISHISNITTANSNVSNTLTVNNIAASSDSTINLTSNTTGTNLSLSGYLHANTIATNSGSTITVGNNVDIGTNYITQSGVRQPLIQSGSSNTGSGSGTTVTMPVAYSSAGAFIVQLTYNGSPSGNQPLYVVSQTASTFRFYGASSSYVYWTTMGDI